MNAVALVALAWSSGFTHAETLKIALVSRTVFYAPLWVADKKGYLASEGIESEFTIYDNAEKINQDLRAGTVHIAISTPESVILDGYAGGSLRIIAGNAGKLPHYIIAKPAIKTLADLKGAKFGVLSLQEGTTYLVKQVAKAAGLGPNDYEIAQVGGAPTRWRLLQEGKIDVGLQPFPLSYEATAAGFTDLGPIAKYVPDYQFSSINVDDRWAKPNARLVSRFLRALKRGQDDLATDPDFASSVAAKELNTTVPLAKRALQDTARLRILSEDLSVSIPGLEYVFGSLLDSGLLPKGTALDFSRFLDNTYLRSSRDLAVRDMGSFFVGGGKTQVTGQPIKQIQYAKDAPPLQVNPNGTYANGQVYVQYVVLSKSHKALPILFLNGGTSTGSMWENTPDGRPGWQMLALQEGYSTYLTDAIGKGRASWARWPEVFKTEPAFRPNEETWPLLRIGQTYTEDPAGRKSFANTAFPVEAFDDFAKSSVPRFPGQDGVEMTAYEQLIERICPCAVVAQSSGGYFATQLASKRPDLIKAIVTVELTAAPDLSKLNASAIANVPQLVLWGDNWKENPTWVRIRSQVDSYVSSLKQKNGKISLVDLPALGISGNTHQMMVDRNNEAVLRVAFAWLDAELTPGSIVKK